MILRRLARLKRVSVHEEEFPNTPASLRYPVSFIHTAMRGKKTSPHGSIGDPAQPKKLSRLDQALKFIHPRVSGPFENKLKIAPSGAIVFTPARSQKSLESSILPAEASTMQSVDPAAARPRLTLVQDLRIPDKASSLRSASFESTRSLQPSISPDRTTEYERQRRYNFLGRHPPPIQRRSVSLPRILESRSPRQFSPRQALFFGGPTNRPRPGYTKIPRFVPLEIRLNPAVTIESIPSSAPCNLNHDDGGRDDVSCNHCGQHFSLISSRSTRGSSEVPNPKTRLVSEEATTDAKGIIKGVGTKFKAVFGRGKENRELKTEEATS